MHIIVHDFKIHFRYVVITQIAARERVYIRRLESYRHERNLLVTYCKRAAEKLRSLQFCAKVEINELKMAIQRMKAELDTYKVLLASRENEIEKILRESSLLQQQQILKPLPVHNPPTDRSENSEEIIQRLKVELMTFKKATEVAVPMLKELRDSLNLKQVKEDMLTQECCRLRARIDEMMLNQINNSSDRNSNISLSEGLDLNSSSESLSIDRAI